MRVSGSKPLVSIGMPVYNEQAFLEQALDAVLSQSFGDYELIISDNASTDRTGEICLEYADRDPRIRYHRADTNVGSITNFNRAFELSSGRYFFWASGHDLRHETFISRCLDILDHDESVVLCYPRARWLESDGQLGDVIAGHVDTRGLDPLSGFHTVLWGLGYAYQMYGIMRSDALEKTGLLRHTVGSGGALLAELSLLGAFAHLPEPLLYMRRLSDYGDFDRYVLKSLGPGAPARSPIHLYCSWIYELLRAVARHGGSWRWRCVAMLSAILCVHTKYRWLLGSVRSLRKTETRGRAEPDAQG